MSTPRICSALNHLFGITQAPSKQFSHIAWSKKSGLVHKRSHGLGGTDGSQRIGKI
jgi:hypothetical protein